MGRYLLTCVALGLVLGLTATAAAEDKKVMLIEFPAVGQVCLTKEEAKDLARRMREIVVPKGAAVTLIAYSDGNDVSRKRPGLTSECISHLVPEGITDHERIAVFRGLQVAEIANEIGLTAFNGTPLLVLGGEMGFRQRDPSAFAIMPRRAQGVESLDRRVEVWISDPSSGTTASFGGGGTVVMTPIVLPPSSYGFGGGAVSSSGDGRPRYMPGAVDDGRGQRVAGWTFVGLAGVAVVGGTLSFLQAQESQDLARSTIDSQQAIEFQNDADLFNQVGAWSMGLGAGFAILGAALVLTAPSLDDEEGDAPSAAFSFSPLDGGGMVGVTFQGP